MFLGRKLRGPGRHWRCMRVNGDVQKKCGASSQLTCGIVWGRRLGASINIAIRVRALPAPGTPGSRSRAAAVSARHRGPQ